MAGSLNLKPVGTVVLEPCCLDTHKQIKTVLGGMTLAQIAIPNSAFLSLFIGTTEGWLGRFLAHFKTADDPKVIPITTTDWEGLARTVYYAGVVRQMACYRHAVTHCTAHKTRGNAGAPNVGAASSVGQGKQIHLAGYWEVIAGTFQ